MLRDMHALVPVAAAFCVGCVSTDRRSREAFLRVVDHNGHTADRFRTVVPFLEAGFQISQEIDRFAGPPKAIRVLEKKAGRADRTSRTRREELFFMDSPKE